MADWYVTATAAGGGTGAVGSPFTIAEAFAKSDYASADVVWIKSGTYTVTATLAHTSVNAVIYKGYDTTVGDQDAVWGEVATKPLITKTGTVGTIIDLQTVPSSNIWNVVISGADNIGVYAGRSLVYNCVMKGCGTHGMRRGTATAYAVCCVAHTNAAIGIESYYSYGCHSYSNGGAGFSSGSVTGCSSYGNAIGYNLTGLVMNCTSSGDGIGIWFNNAFDSMAINCVVEDAGTYAYVGFSGKVSFLMSCCSWNSGTARSSLISSDLNPITTDPALTAPATGDFSVGSNMYGKGTYMGSIGGVGTLDIGAIQKTSGAGSGTGYPSENDVRDTVVFGAASEYEGDLVLPAVTDVKTGVQYGADGTEFTGTFGGGGTSAIIGLADIATQLLTITGIKQVFNDGYLRDFMVDGRHLGNVPYAEFKETQSDNEEHTSTSRMQRRTVEGRLILRKNIHAYDTFLTALKVAFDSDEQYHVVYDEIPDFSPQTVGIGFSIRFFTVATK